MPLANIRTSAVAEAVASFDGCEFPAGTAFNPHLNLKIKHLASASSMAPPVEAADAAAARLPREEPLVSAGV